MLQRLARLLLRVNGYPQEYLCLEAGSMSDLFQWTLDGSRIHPKDIRFLGYRPLVLALDDRPGGSLLELHLGGRPLAGIELAALSIPGFQTYTGVRCWQRFLPWPLAMIDRTRQWINSRQPGNVTKSLSEYDMLRIAYAQPREVHLAVVGPPERCNVFPTDLHGPIGESGYVISLRHANRACRQAQATGSLVLCRMGLDRYRSVYGLARRHGASMEVAGNITAMSGSAFGHVLPEGALDVVHLQLKEHFDVGIHRLLVFKVEGTHRLKEGPSLAHAHAGPLSALRRAGHDVPVLLR